MGLFNINMPMLYGEGNRAFIRLQEEIIKASDDLSIFAWTAPESDFCTLSGLLASSPAFFATPGNLSWTANKNLPHGITNKGVKLIAKIVPKENGEYTAVLEGVYSHSLGSNPIGIQLTKIYDDQYQRVDSHRLKSVAWTPLDDLSTMPNVFVRQTGEITNTTEDSDSMFHRRASYIYIRFIGSLLGCSIRIVDARPPGLWDPGSGKLDGTFTFPPTGIHVWPLPPVTLSVEILHHSTVIRNFTVSVNLSKMWGDCVCVESGGRSVTQITSNSTRSGEFAFNFFAEGLTNGESVILRVFYARVVKTSEPRKVNVFLKLMITQ